MIEKRTAQDLDIIGATLRILHLRHRYGSRSRDRIGGGSESLTPLNIISCCSPFNRSAAPCA
jgi:hypothetical protein